MPLLPEKVPPIKRVLDIVISTLGLIIFSPLIIIITLLNFLLLGPPIFFYQQRPGYRGVPFTIYKFRTMYDKYSSEGKLLPEEQRITKFGRLLRALSLDELPELFNVIKGEMSIVGPRPLLMQYLNRYSPDQARRHDVLPGITGWAQINGRNAITWEEKFNLDLWYVDHWSFSLDLKIIFLTAWKVLIREGIDEPGHISAGEFMGSQDQNHVSRDSMD